MKRLIPNRPNAAVTLAMLVLAACSGGDGSDRAIAQSFGFSERVGDWVISCPRGRAPGTVTECRLGRFSAPAEVQGVDNTLLIRATPAGLRLDDPSSRFERDCGISPDVQRVDDTPLAGLGVEARIALLTSGRTYFRETLQGPPDCRLSVGRTSLAGFGPAYARFLEVSRGFGLADGSG
jgi:hypothetical protein